MTSCKSYSFFTLDAKSKVTAANNTKICPRYPKYSIILKILNNTQKYSIIPRSLGATPVYSDKLHQID